MLKILQLLIIAWLFFSWVKVIVIDREYNDTFFTALRDMFAGDKEDLGMGLLALGIVVGLPIILVIWFINVIF